MRRGARVHCRVQTIRSAPISLLFEAGAIWARVPERSLTCAFGQVQRVAQYPGVVEGELVFAWIADPLNRCGIVAGDGRCPIDPREERHGADMAAGIASRVGIDTELAEIFERMRLE